MHMLPLHVQSKDTKEKNNGTTTKTKAMSNKNNIQNVSANQNVSPIEFDTRW